MIFTRCEKHISLRPAGTGEPGIENPREPGPPGPFLDAALVHAHAPAPAEYSTGLGFEPRGGLTLDVMFTSADWDVPRRITAIALNDDVDEPDEFRAIYFDTAPCASTNHNPSTGGFACIEDPLYNDAIIVTGNEDNVQDQPLMPFWWR